MSFIDRVAPFFLSLGLCSTAELHLFRGTKFPHAESYLLIIQFLISVLFSFSFCFALFVDTDRQR